MLMRGGAVFLAFFLLFTLASLAVPVPLFPGSMIHAVFSLPTDAYAPLISALTNGITYGLVVWLVFFVVSKKIDESGVSDFKSRKGQTQRNHRKRATKTS
jgi:mannitol-specific phosphotransferase system IIBC component